MWNGAEEEDHRNAGANGLGSSPDQAPPPPAPKPTQALSIIIQSLIDTGAGAETNWLFFSTKFGESALCKEDNYAIIKPKISTDTDIDNPPWPGGSYTLMIDGMDCEYKNDGTNAGALWCKEKNGQPIVCKAEDMRWEKKSKNCVKPGDWRIDQHAVVSCEW
jgi:hypothetical protein